VCVWTVRDRIPVVGEIFRTSPDRPWSPPSLLYNGYRIFPGVKVRPGRAADHSPPFSAAVMEEYSYTSTHPLGHTGPETVNLYHIYTHCVCVCVCVCVSVCVCVCVCECVCVCWPNASSSNKIKWQMEAFFFNYLVFFDWLPYCCDIVASSL